MNMQKKTSRLTHIKIKNSNQKQILDFIRKNENISRAQISKELSLSRPAVSSNIAELLAQNVIAENGVLDSQGGRKGISLRINSAYGVFIGIIFQKNLIRIKYYDFSYKIVFQEDLTIDTGMNTAQNIIDALQKSIYNKVAQFCSGHLLYVVISFPGIIDDNKVVLSNAIPLFNGADIGELFNSIAKDKIDVVNNMTVKVIGMHEKFSYKDYSNIVYLSHEQDGVGSGLIINDQVYEGAGKGAGEVGLMFNVTNPLPVKNLKNNIVKFGSLLFQTKISDCRSLDEWCENILHDTEKLEQISQYYSIVINNFGHIIDPDIIILGGLLTKLGNPFFKKVTYYIQQISKTPIKVVLSDFDEQAINLGLAVIGDKHISRLIIT